MECPKPRSRRWRVQCRRRKDWHPSLHLLVGLGRSKTAAFILYCRSHDPVHFAADRINGLQAFPETKLMTKRSMNLPQVGGSPPGSRFRGPHIHDGGVVWPHVRLGARAHRRSCPRSSAFLQKSLACCLLQFSIISAWHDSTSRLKLLLALSICWPILL